MNFIIYITLGLFCLFSVKEASLLGARECTYGPRYWCGSIVNAKQCKAVKHCIQTVWEKQILPEDNDDVCSICKEMVKEARDQLLSNQTQEDIKAVFEGSCKLIPVKMIAKECIFITGEFIPELIDTLASQMNPQAVCATAQLCNNPYVDKVLAQYQEENRKRINIDHTNEMSSSSNCQDCKTFVQDIAETVQTHSRADVLDHLLAICARLSSLSEGCMALVQNNFQMIYDFLSTGLRPDDICELFGMCDRMYGQSVVVLPKTGDETCDFCVAIINSWRNNLLANTTKDEFKMILNGICHHTGNFEKECLSLVDQYFEVIYDILTSEIHPKEICKTVGLCGPNSVFKSDVPIWTTLQIKPENHLPLVPLRPSFDNDNLIGLDEANSYRKDNIHLPRVSLTRNSVSVVIAGEKGVLNVDKKNSNQCIMCQFVLHFLQNLLNDQKTREQIEHAVENVCQLFPKSIQEQCDDYIDAYGDQLIQLLILEIDPASICPMLKLCPGEGVGLQTALDKDSGCVLCEFAMTELDEILKDKDNEEAIKEAIEKVCYQLPKSIREQCKELVDTYTDQIVDLLINDFTPGQVCAQLGLCPSKRGPKVPYLPSPENAQLPLTRMFVPQVQLQGAVQEKKKFDQSTECILCEFIIKRIDTIILSGATVEEIEQLVDGVCKLMPPTVMHDCLNFMEEYGKAIIEMLINEINPDFVCSELKLCIHHISEVMPKAAVKFPANECLVCEEVMKFVESDVVAKQEREYVSGLILDNVCHHLPGEEAHQMCKDIATTYGEFLDKLLQELKDGKRVCQAIRKCPIARRSKMLLGGQKCTWGPGYWCQSKMHADSCGATEHCINKVWKNGVPAA